MSQAQIRYGAPRICTNPTCLTVETHFVEQIKVANEWSNVYEPKVCRICKSGSLTPFIHHVIDVLQAATELFTYEINKRDGELEKRTITLKDIYKLFDVVDAKAMLEDKKKTDALKEELADLDKLQIITERGGKSLDAASYARRQELIKQLSPAFHKQSEPNRRFV